MEISIWSKKTKRNIPKRLQFADFTSDDIESFGLLEDSRFVPYVELGFKEKIELLSGEPLSESMESQYSKYAKYLFDQDTKFPVYSIMIGYYGDVLVNFLISEGTEGGYSFVVQIETDFALPHMTIIPKGHPKTTLFDNSSNSVNINFGKFSQFYNVVIPKEYEVNAFEILPPDTMVRLMEEIPDIFIHYKNSLITFEFTMIESINILSKKDLLKINKSLFVKELSVLLDSLSNILKSARTGRIALEEQAPAGSPAISLATGKAPTTISGGILGWVALSIFPAYGFGFIFSVMYPLFSFLSFLWGSVVMLSLAAYGFLYLPYKERKRKAEREEEGWSQ
jgi:hypothetical protein